METWQEVLRKNSIASLDALALKFGPENFPELDRLRQAADNFEFRISPAMVDLIKSPDDPMWRQYVPSVEELDVVDGIVDSLNEDADSPVPNITHRYPDRALFLVSPVCATYCRFCTRRRKVGDPEKIPMSQFESAFRYLEEHTEIRDVIMSGGDPLLLNDRRLEAILTRLRAIPHLQIIRIGSRIPCHLPERITPELCAMLKRFHPLFINTHFNHPDELTPAAVAALGMLADAGIPLGCQTVLLKGVNDTPAVMMELMHRLLMARVRPYYIYMADQVAGRRALPHLGADRHRDHAGAPGLDQRAGHPLLRDRRPGRRRQDPDPAGVRREHERGRGGAEELPGRAVRLPAAAGGGRGHRPEEAAEAGGEGAEAEDGVVTECSRASRVRTGASDPATRDDYRIPRHASPIDPPPRSPLSPGVGVQLHILQPPLHRRHVGQRVEEDRGRIGVERVHRLPPQPPGALPTSASRRGRPRAASRTPDCRSARSSAPPHPARVH